MPSDQTIQDILKGVGSVATSGIGAYLALLLKDRLENVAILAQPASKNTRG